MAIADDLNIGNLIDFRGILGSGMDIIMFVLFGLIILALILIILDQKKYIHKFRVREVTNNRKIIKDTRAKEFKNKDDGALYWKLKSTKEVLPVPPSEAIEVDSKGHKCVEAYKLPTGEYAYISDGKQFKEIPSDILNERDEATRNQLLAEW